MLETIKKKQTTIVRWIMLIVTLCFHFTQHEILFMISIALFAGASYHEGYCNGVTDGVRGAVAKINSEINRCREEEANGKISRDEDTI